MGKIFKNMIPYWETADPGVIAVVCAGVVRSVTAGIHIGHY